MSTYRLTDALSKAEDMEDAYFSAAMTDAYRLGNWKEAGGEGGTDPALSEEKLLELRIFNRDREVKLFRAAVGDPFILRVIDDRYGDAAHEDYFDQLQFLDIDTKAGTEGRRVQTTTSGSYTLPEKIDLHREALENLCLKVRYYFGRYEDGQAYICDWRCVGFEPYEGKVV